MVKKQDVDFSNFSLDWDKLDALSDRVAEAICLNESLSEINAEEFLKTCVKLFGEEIVNKATSKVKNGIVKLVPQQTIDAIKNAEDLKGKAEALINSDQEIIHVVYSIYNIMTNEYKDQYVGLYAFTNPVQFMEFNALLHKDEFMIVSTLTRA